MSFFMCICSTDGRPLAHDSIARFQSASGRYSRLIGEQVQEKVFPCYRIVYHGFSALWSGPSLHSSEDGFLFGCGTENPLRVDTNGEESIERIGYALREVPAVDHKRLAPFSDCAGVCAESGGRSVTALNDPLGTHTVAYYCWGTTVVISDRIGCLAHYLDPVEIDYQALFEFLTLGHQLGNKTLFKEVYILPPGGFLRITDGKLAVSRYVHFERVAINHALSLEDAVRMIVESVLQNIAQSSDKVKFDCFLSGGWDSRLLAALLARVGALRQTWTTDQRGEYAESRMASLISGKLNVPNRFIPQRNLSYPVKFDRHIMLTDFSSDNGPWIMTLLDHLPVGTPLVDGYLVDVVLRGDRHVFPELQECIRRGMVTEAAEYYFNIYREQGGPFLSVKGGGTSWRSMLTKEFYDDQICRLKKTIRKEFEACASAEDFVTAFVIKNRQRRSIASLPNNLMGSRGPVLLPFSNYDLVRLCLSVPIQYRMSRQLHHALLARLFPDLCDVVSTNSSREVLIPFRRRRSIFDMYHKLLSGLYVVCNAVNGSSSVIAPVLRKERMTGLNPILFKPYHAARLVYIKHALKMVSSK